MSVAMADLPKYHVEVHFGAGIAADAQGKAMLAFEKHLRELTGMWVEVFGDRKADDSRLRRSMTAEERARL
jgi:hypothetical protein